MIKLYRAIRKWLVLVTWVHPKQYKKCGDCVDEAMADCGLYWRDDVPQSKEKQFAKNYKIEYYYAHLDPWGWNSKVRVR